VESILREWIGTYPEPVGVFVTCHHVCYWRGQREHPFLRVELHDWLSICQPRVAVFYVGEQAAEEIRQFVERLVAQDAEIPTSARKSAVRASWNDLEAS
jgi:hypothetical protein